MTRSIACSLLVLGAVLLGAAPASAYTYTSWRWSFENGGYVSASDPLSYTHAFTPSHTGSLTVDQVTLGIAVHDDLDMAQEWVEIMIEVNDAESLFASGSATSNVFYGDVTAIAEIQAWGDQLRVNVYSTGGDFRVVASRAEFTYRTGSTSRISDGPIVPEPGAAMVFGLGSLLIGAAIQRRA